jgi:hypothetical protein
MFVATIFLLTKKSKEDIYFLVTRNIGYEKGVTYNMDKNKPLHRIDVFAHNINWFSSINKICIPLSLLGSYRDVFNEK